MGCSSSTAGRLAMEGAGADMIVALLLEENVTRVLESIEIIMMRVLPIFYSSVPSQIEVFKKIKI